MPKENMNQEFIFKKIDKIRNCLIVEISFTLPPPLLLLFCDS